MRKIIVFNLISVDGMFARENGDIDWHMVDDEFNKFAVEHTAEFGTLIFGRITYDIFEDFWPKAMNNPKMSSDDRKIGKIIDDMDKIVFSKKKKDLKWLNAKQYTEIDPIEIKKWKEQDGKPMAIFGSGTIVQQFANLGLIDEYRLMVNPIVLGKGKPLFENVKEFKLKLLRTKTFGNGNILLTYKSENK